jgi:3-phenylpropionate/trans-cinnamate dioxygenase ferredoxin subunit
MSDVVDGSGTAGAEAQVVVGQVSDFVDGATRRVEVEGIPVCVVRLGDDWYAIGDTCSHAEFSLSEGDVWPDECEIECPKHGATFSLRTGEPQTLPATQPVPVYDVVIVGDTVEVRTR